MIVKKKYLIDYVKILIFIIVFLVFAVVLFAFLDFFEIIDVPEKYSIPY